MSRKKSGRATGRMQGGVVYSKPDIYVSVYCVGTPGTPEHPHDKWRIASFYPYVHDDEIVWRSFSENYYEPESPYALHISGNVSQQLNGNEWVSVGDVDPGVIYGTDFRLRWNLACGRCGMRRTIATPSDFYEEFTALAQLQIPELELIHLVHAQRNAE